MIFTQSSNTDMPPVGCPGPLIWFAVEEYGAILECATCGYVVCTGNFFDLAHMATPTLREGLAA